MAQTQLYVAYLQYFYPFLCVVDIHAKMRMMMMMIIIMPWWFAVKGFKALDLCQFLNFFFGAILLCHKHNSLFWDVILHKRLCMSCNHNCWVHAAILFLSSSFHLNYQPKQPNLLHSKHMSLFHFLAEKKININVVTFCYWFYVDVQFHAYMLESLKKSWTITICNFLYPIFSKNENNVITYFYSRWHLFFEKKNWERYSILFFF